MAVIRINKTADYTVMSNTHFKEKEMSLKAKGLLSLMLSLPNDWDYSIAGLVTLSKDGKDSVMGALNELEDFGYLVRTKLIDKNGRFAGYDYDIFEEPNAVKPNADEPYAEKPNTENPPQLNTNKSTTKKTNTNELKKESKKASFDELINSFTENEEERELLREWLKVRKAKRAAMTNRSIELNLKKLRELADKSNMSVVDYLQEAIRRGWLAFFEIKDYNNRPAKQQTEKKNESPYDLSHIGVIYR